MNSDTWLTIGKVTGVHGLAGKLKVWSFAESLDTFAKGRKIRIQDEGADNGDLFTIAKASSQKKGILLVLEKVTTREQAEALVGKELLMDKAQLPDLEEDTWYWEDLYGLRVSDRELGPLGTIDRIFPTGADDILVVTDKGTPEGPEILIPMNRHFVLNVDIEAGQVFTDLPQGFVLD